MKFLIIDDDPFELLLAKKLVGLKYEVEGFTSIPESSWVRNNPFEIVLIDYHLGKGITAQHVLRVLQKDAGNTFKAYVLSNHVDEAQVAELKSGGFTDVLFKPLTLEKIIELLA